MQTQKQLERNATVSNEALEPISTTLDSPRTKLVYLYLSMAGTGTVEEVRDALGMQLISLYPVLDTLVSKGLVEQDGSRYVCSKIA